MKELYIQCHEELIMQYLEDHPDATEEEAVEATADKAWDATSDRYADMCDRALDEHRDRQMRGLA